MSILDIDKEYDPISPIYINTVLGFRHLMSFPTHTIWVQDFAYRKDDFFQGLPGTYSYYQIYRIYINKFENVPTDQQWSVQSSTFGEAPDNGVYVNDVNELRIAIEAIKNKYKI